MLLALISDLHLDLLPRSLADDVTSRLASALRARRADVLLIAGDVVNHHGLLARYLAPLAVARAANLYLPGNHDVWLTDAERAAGVSSWDAHERLGAAARDAGFHFLPGAPRLVEGWGFAGTLGWYDHRFADPAVPATTAMYESQRLFGRQAWNDARKVAWHAGGRTQAAAEVSAAMVEMFARDLASIGVTHSGGPPTVAASHMLPRAELLSQRPGDWQWQFGNAFMGSPALGALHAQHPSVRLVVAGHRHTPARLELDGRPHVVAPLGYYGLGEAPADPAERVCFARLDAGGRLSLE